MASARSVLLSLRLPLCVAAALALLVVSAGHFFALTRASVQSRVPVTERHPTAAVGIHSTAAWPAGKGRNFQQSPLWAARVTRGELPDIAERLPDRPLVIVPPESLGPYGGTWSRYSASLGEPLRVEVEWNLNYTTLVRWSPCGTRLLADVAESYEVSGDDRTFTFRLRKGMRWSDGAPFTSADIRFWFDDVLNDIRLSSGVPPEFVQDGQSVSLETPDPQTVRFVLAKPSTLFLERMAFGLWGSDMVSAPRHYLSQFHATYRGEQPADAEARAAGFSAWSEQFRNRSSWRNPDCPRLWAWVMRTPPPATTVVLERNPYYWKVDPEGRQLPYIDRVTFTLTEPDTIVLKLMRGDSPMQERYITFKDYPLLMAHQEHGGYRVRHWMGAQVVQVVLNRAHKNAAMRALMDDGRFARALSLGIDRSELIELFAGGLGRPTQPVPAPGTPFYSEHFASLDTQHDEAEANRLLDAAGCSRGADGWRRRPDGEPLRLQLDTLAPVLVPLGQVLAQSWARLGVAVEVNLRARELYYMRKDAGAQDMLLDSGAGGNELNPLLDPRAYIPNTGESSWSGLFGTYLRSGGKAGETPPPDILKIVEDWTVIETTRDSEERRRRFHAILERHAERRACIGLYTAPPPFLIVRNDCLNVPQVTTLAWSFRGPGCTAPECYALDPARARASTKEAP